MGIGAAIAAAVILAPFFVLYLEEPQVMMQPQPQGVPAGGALDPPLLRPTIERLLENASPPLGEPDAPVTLVEFGDYQCTFCHRFFVQTEPTIVSEYVNAGLVKIYFRDYIVIGPDSVTAALAAKCAGDQGLYWEFHDAIYGNYQGEQSGWASEAGIARIATSVDGLESEEWVECMQSTKHLEVIDASSQDARALGLTGTPAFYVIGSDGEITLLRGAKPLTEFRAAIDAGLAG